ncbi:hypothetical protein LZ31DRAFT_556660 [Colletotrichum somersetense]|nr:hypothetical protein LZ31DRAFT_556660 [Colletotrichum somersetense]
MPGNYCMAGNPIPRGVHPPDPVTMHPNMMLLRLQAIRPARPPSSTIPSAVCSPPPVD